MLSRISKISVFGIVALMLVLGLTAGDALAARSATVSVNPTELRAASTGQTLTFTVNVTDDIAGLDPAEIAESTVTINIPSFWTQPVGTDAGGENPPGEVNFTSVATGGDGEVNGRNIILTVPKVTANTTHAFTVAYTGVTAPHFADTYGFPLTNAIDADGADNDATDNPAQVEVEVGPVNSGAGDIGLRWTAGTLYRHPNGDAESPNAAGDYRNKYIVFSEQSLANLIITFTAAGTMPAGSIVTLTSEGFDAFTRADNGEVSLGGSVTSKLDFLRAADNVTATVKGGDAPQTLQKGDTIIVTIKNYKAPKLEDTATESIDTGYTIEVETTVTAETRFGGVNAATNVTGTQPVVTGPPDAVLDPQFQFVTTRQHGRGKMVVMYNANPFTHVVTGTDISANALSFTFTETGGIAQGSKFEIDIPVGWSNPFKPIDPTSTADGAVNGADLAGPNLRTVAGDLISPPTITYRVAKAPAPGAYPFEARGSAGPHPAGLADMTDTTVEVTAAHGSGKVIVREGGVLFKETISEKAIPELELIFEATGRMAVGAVAVIALPSQGIWTNFREFNNDPTADPGEVRLKSGNATLTRAAQSLTLTATAVWETGHQIKLSYKNVKVPKVDGTASHSFTATAQSFADGVNGVPNDTAAAAGAHNVGIGRARDGGGSIAITAPSPPEADAGSTIAEIVFSYTAEGKMEVGAQVEITLPTDGTWDSPSGIGKVTLDDNRSVSLGTTGTSMTATTVVPLDTGDKIVFRYKNVQVPDAGRYTFTAKSKSSPRAGSGLEAITSADMSITILAVQAGSVALTDADGATVRYVTPSKVLGNLTLTFKADTRMEANSEVQFTIPESWGGTVFEDNNSGGELEAGEISLVAGDSFGVDGRIVTVTSSAGLALNGILAVMYGAAVAPATEDGYPFTAQSKLSADSGLLDIRTYPTVIVRKLITEISIVAVPSSVFVGEDVSVTVMLSDADTEATNEAGNASGPMDIMLSDGDAGGTFTPASLLTISDNGSMATATYNNDNDGDVTLTATSGNFTDEASIEVKSTISNLQVNGMKAPAPLTGNEKIIVTVVGQAGEANVRVVEKETDADGVEIVSSVVSTKGFDPDPDVEVPEGSVAYTRDFDLSGLDEGIYTVEVTIAGKMAEIEIEVVASREPVTALTLTPSAENFFAGESITVAVASDSRAPIGGLEVTLSTDPAESGMFSMTKGGDAISTVMIEDSADSMSVMVYYTNSTLGIVTLKAAAGDDLAASDDVEVKSTITALIDGMEEPDAVAPGATISVSAVAKAGGGTVMVTDAEGEPVESLTGLGLNVDADAADVPEGSVAYTVDIDLPANIADGTYTVTVTIGSESESNEFEVKTPRPPVMALTLTVSAESFFASDSITVTVASDARAPVDGLEVALSTDPADSGMFSMTEGGDAISTVMIEDSADSMSAMVYYTNDAAGAVTLMATAGDELAASVDVTVKPTISDLQVNDMDVAEPVEVGASITVSATGKADQTASVQITDADGGVVVSTKHLDPDGDAVDGAQKYSRAIELPSGDDLPEGEYTVTVTIGDYPPDMITIDVVAARDPVTELTVTASADSFFAGESITVTVASDSRAPVGGLEVTLSTDPADSGMFSMTEGGDAISTVMIEDSADSMSAMVYYTNDASGAVTLMAAAGEDLTASAAVSVNPTITVQVNGMDAPEAVLPGATISVTATGKVGGGTVMVTDADGDAVGSLTGLGLNIDADAEVPEGSVAYMRDIELPAEIADGTYTVTVTIGSETESIDVEVMTPEIPPEPITAIAVEADPTSVFPGEDIAVSVTLWDADGEGEASVEMVINLSDGDAGGSFTDAEGNAITSVTIAVGGFDASATYSNNTPGAITLMATAADETMELDPATVDVTVKPTISNFQVNGMDEPDPLTAGVTITVSATGIAGKATVSITDADGNPVVPSEGLKGLDEDPDEEGNVAYTRDVDLPADLTDGMYTVTVSIAGETATMDIEVINDQSPPMLANPKLLPDTVASGSVITLTIEATSNVPNAELSVTADVSDIDADEAAVQLSKQPGTDNTYVAIYVVKNSDPKDDGDKSITFMASDRLGGESEMTATTSLKNDVTAPELSMASAIPSPASNDMVVTISVNGGESGLTVTADASAIGGEAAVALDEGMMAADGNGMDANGNGDDMGANGNGDNGMTETAMPAGDGMYSGTVTVTDADDGEQTITIKATDGSGNESQTTASITIDNSGPMLSDASADPSMATNGTEVTISVSTEPDATVMADASAIGGGEVALTDDDGDNVYTASVMVAAAEDGEQMVTISATDALGNESEAVMVSVTVDNTGPTLSDASADPAEAVNGDMVTISVMGGESGLTVMADASALGAEAAVELTDADTAGSYIGTVEVNADSGGDKMVSITATDALGNAGEAVTVTVSVHEVTSVSFSPAQVSTGDSVTVTAMGTAGLTATFRVFNAEMDIVDGKAMEESADGGSYTGSFDIVVDAHPTGEYWVSASVGKASMTAEAALTIDHKAQFTLSIPAGTHAIHVPLDVTHIDGEAGTIETVGDLYDALGESVNFIITLGADGNWMSYLGDESAGSMADAAIGDDTGLIAVMKSGATLELTGNALGTGGVSQINIEIGNNLVGVPLDPVVDMMISGALVEGVGAIAVSNAAGDGFHTITAPDDTGDGPIMGGVGYIVVATAAANIPIVGSAWENEEAPMAAPGVAFSGSQTPVLHVDGGVMDEFDMLARVPELRVTVRNLSTGASLDTVLGTDESTTAYSATFVEFGRHAAKAGDVLEIVAHSPNPYVGVRPVPQIVVSAEEVLTSRISLPDLELYEIPSETELLANYPNPFNPETWIPYRLAQAAEVTLDIYDTTGRLVRTIDVGFKPAAVYESRASAIYWDGRNNYGERVASGTYFYHLTAGDDYASTRRMVILK